MKRRWPLFVALTVLAVVVAVPLLLDAHHRKALELYRQTLRASGDFKTLAEAMPGPLTDATNGGPALMAVLARLPFIPTAFQPVVVPRLPPGQRGVTWSQFTLPEGYNTTDWSGLRDFLSLNATDLAALRTACEAPVFEFPLRYQDGVKMPFPHLNKVHVLAQIFAADALLQLHDGYPDIALADVRVGLQFVARWNREPPLNTQLARIRMSWSLADTTWELLQFHGWTDAQLASLHRAWQELDLPASAERALDLEQIWEQKAIVDLTRASYATIKSGMCRCMSPGAEEIVRLCWQDPPEAFNAVLGGYPHWWAFQLWRHHQLALVNLQQTQTIREACRAAKTSGAWDGPSSKAQKAINQFEATLPRLPFGRTFDTGDRF
jgi:hypothetical protein